MRRSARRSASKGSSSAEARDGSSWSVTISARAAQHWCDAGGHARRRALLERDAGAALGQLEQLVAADLPPVIKMRHHRQGLIKTYARVPYLKRLAVMLLCAGDADAGQDVTQVVRPVIDAQRRIIEQGIAAGDFRPIDPLLFYFASISACDGIFGGRATLAALFDYDGPVESLRRLHAEQTVTLLLDGLVKASG